MNRSSNGRGRLVNIARREMIARGLLPDFSAAALRETEGIADAAVDSGPSIRDLRGLLWASIDNDDSRDLDQLSVSAPGPGDSVKIFVAVADVDAVVHRGSAIDDHARANTTSVYTPAAIFPMLPEKLSTNLTSLGEGDERLAIVTEMMVGADGVVQTTDIYRARVLNHAKLAYGSVAAFLNGAAATGRIAEVPELDRQLRTQDRIAQAMKSLRHRSGALSLKTIEPRAVFNGEDLADLRVDEQNRAQNLIEDFMVAVNGVTARYLDGKGFPSMRRVLRSPERWERIVELASNAGEQLPSEPDGLALEEFLRKRQAAAPARFPDLSLSVVKLLGRGTYVVEPPGREGPGHFGLAVRDYTHSTAPNRRFPDLITQRLLKAALAGRPQPYDIEELTELAKACTEREDSATKVERQVRKSAAALLLESRIGERFGAIVTGASAKGTWVRIGHPAVEGKVVRGHDGLDVGEQVQVVLVHVNVERGFIDFARAS